MHQKSLWAGPALVLLVLLFAASSTSESSGGITSIGYVVLAVAMFAMLFLIDFVGSNQLSLKTLSWEDFLKGGSPSGLGFSWNTNSASYRGKVSQVRLSGEFLVFELEWVVILDLRRRSGERFVEGPFLISVRPATSGIRKTGTEGELFFEARSPEGDSGYGNLYPTSDRAIPSEALGRIKSAQLEWN